MSYKKVLEELTNEEFDIPGKGVMGIIKPTLQNFPIESDRIIASQNNVIIKLLSYIADKKAILPENGKIEELISSFEKLKPYGKREAVKKFASNKLWYLKEKDPKDIMKDQNN